MPAHVALQVALEALWDRGIGCSGSTERGGAGCRIWTAATRNGAGLSTRLTHELVRLLLLVHAVQGEPLHRERLAMVRELLQDLVGGLDALLELLALVAFLQEGSAGGRRQIKRSSQTPLNMRRNNNELFHRTLILNSSGFRCNYVAVAAKVDRTIEVRIGNALQTVHECESAPRRCGTAQPPSQGAAGPGQASSPGSPSRRRTAQATRKATARKRDDHLTRSCWRPPLRSGGAARDRSRTRFSGFSFAPVPRPPRPCAQAAPQCVGHSPDGAVSSQEGSGRLRCPRNDKLPVELVLSARSAG